MLRTAHYEAVRRELIRLLRKERERRNLSNYAVCQRSGVSESTLSLVERGLRNPSIELMLRIADGIGANLPALLEEAIHEVTAQAGSKPVLRKRHPARKPSPSLRTNAQRRPT